MFVAAFSVATLSSAEDGDPGPSCSSQATGLLVFVNAGALKASNNTAIFYSGRPENVNNVDRILHSELYGPSIWQNLTEQDLINSSISNYQMLSVDEYGLMRYNIAFQVGLGLRYDYKSGFGWMLKFDVAQLNAVGAFNLNATTGVGELQQRSRYVRCAVAGSERRINIDFGITKKINLTTNMSLDLNAGLNVVNTKVQSNDVEIGGEIYSILDVWDGQTLSYYTQPYEYINQGGLGLGGFATAALCRNFAGIGTVSLGYTSYYSHINLEGYPLYGWQHNVFLRFEINNFIFL